MKDCCRAVPWVQTLPRAQWHSFPALHERRHLTMESCIPGTHEVRSVGPQLRLALERQTYTEYGAGRSSMSAISCITHFGWNGLVQRHSLDIAETILVHCCEFDGPYKAFGDVKSSRLDEHSEHVYQGRNGYHSYKLDNRYPSTRSWHFLRDGNSPIHSEVWESSFEKWHSRVELLSDQSKFVHWYSQLRRVANLDCLPVLKCTDRGLYYEEEEMQRWVEWTIIVDIAREKSID